MYYKKRNCAALFPISCICERFIYSHDRSTYFAAIYKSLTDTVHKCRNWEQGRAVSFLGIFFSNFRYSVLAVEYMNIFKHGT
jgi:hypothetical protein